MSYTLEFQSEKFDVTVGHYPDGKHGEVFLSRIKDKTAARLGQHLDATARDAAILISIALQHNVELSNLSHSITRDDDNNPMSILGAVIDSMEDVK